MPLTYQAAATAAKQRDIFSDGLPGSEPPCERRARDGLIKMQSAEARQWHDVEL